MIELLALAALTLQTHPFEGLDVGDRIEVTFTSRRRMTGWIKSIKKDRRSLRLDVSHDFPDLKGTMRIESFKVRKIRKLDQIDREAHKLRVDEATRELEKADARRRGREAEAEGVRALSFDGDTVTRRKGAFKVITDAGSGVAERVAADLVEAFGDFSGFFTPPPDGGAGYKVYVYSSERSFARYFVRALNQKWNPISRGFYVPKERTLVLYYDGNYVRLKPFLRHEGFHAYLHGLGVRAPAWFNEGMAVYFETASASRASPNPTRARELKLIGEVDGLVDLDALRKVNYSDYHAKTVTVVQGSLTHTVPRYYAQGWSWIFFLVNQGHPAVLRTYLSGLRAGRSAAEAWTAATEGIDLDGLEAQWRRSLRSP